MGMKARKFVIVYCSEKSSKRYVNIVRERKLYKGREAGGSINPRDWIFIAGI